MGARRWLLAIGAAIAAMLLIGRGLASLYVDYLWYDSLGAASVWRARTFLGGAAWIVSAAVGIGFIFANLYAVRRTVASVSLPRRVANLEIGEEVPPRYLTLGTFAVSALLGLIFTLPADKWTSLEMIRIGERFGETDPYYQKDLSFWTSWLPFETDLFVWSLIAVLLVTVMVVFLYVMTRSVRRERGRLVVGSHARRHFAVLGAVMLLLLAWSYRLDGFELLNTGTGAGGAFTYLDHRVAKPIGDVLAVISVAAAAIVLFTVWTGQTGAAAWTVGGLLVLSVLLHQAGPLIARRMAEPRDPEQRERPYVATRAGYTRRAYAVDRIVEDPGVAARLTAPAIANGLPLWDASALGMAAGIRTVRPHLPIGWRASPAGLSAVIARSESVDERATWTVARYDARHADERGAPIRIDDAGDMTLAGQPASVHPGATGTLVLSDSAGEMAGASLDRPFSRIAHAWSLQNFRLLFDDLPHPAPRIVLRRSVRERVEALVPFLVVGSDVTPLVAGDSLLWVAHLYTASSSYPLSRRFLLESRERAYFQHAAVAFTDARTGRVTIVPDSLPDPLARAWIRRFPSIFTARRTAGVAGVAAERVPPGIEGARAQALAFAAAGTRTEAIGHQLVWNDGADTALTRAAVTPVFLPDAAGGASPVVVQVMLDELERVDGLLLSFGGLRGQTVWMPVNGGERWPLVIERLQRPPDTTGTAAGLHGPVRAFPAATGVLFAQTTYAHRPGAAPTVLYVALLEQGRVSTGPTVAAALGVADTRADSIGAPRTPADFRTRVTQLYESMRRALQRGDWTAFGQAYEALGRLLGRPPQ